MEKASVIVAVSQTMHQLKRCRIGAPGVAGERTKPPSFEELWPSFTAILFP